MRRFLRSPRRGTEAALTFFAYRDDILPHPASCISYPAFPLTSSLWSLHSHFLHLSSPRSPIAATTSPLCVHRCSSAVPYPILHPAFPAARKLNIPPRWAASAARCAGQFARARLRPLNALFAAPGTHAAHAAPPRLSRARTAPAASARYAARSESPVPAAASPPATPRNPLSAARSPFAIHYALFDIPRPVSMPLPSPRGCLHTRAAGSRAPTCADAAPANMPLSVRSTHGTTPRSGINSSGSVLGQFLHMHPQGHSVRYTKRNFIAANAINSTFGLTSISAVSP